jgi:NAD(P)H-hydrate epimerase
LVGRKAEVKHDPGVNVDLLRVPILEAPDLEGFEKVKEQLQGSDLIIDALFGIGLNAELKSPYLEIITYLNSLGKPILSVDVPSGLNATDGRLMGAGIFATKTVTFAAAKTGFNKGVGPAHVGEVVVVDIGIPV